MLEGRRRRADAQQEKMKKYNADATAKALKGMIARRS
jgi:hypothetical protein